MTFVFGWYSFNLKSYTAKDLELFEEKWKDSQFLVRQQVFHIFWIPFFSMGKLYVEQRDGIKHQLPEQIISKIAARGKIRTPWYSFLLLILIIIIPIIIWVYITVAESIMENNFYQQDKKMYNTSINEIQSNLKNLSKNAYIQIISTENINDDTNKKFLKLININGDLYEFQLMEMHFPKNPEDQYYFKKTDDKVLTINKNKLQEAIRVDYDSFLKNTPYGIDFFNNGKYSIAKIEYFDRTVISGEEDWRFWDLKRNRNFYYNSLQRVNEISLDLQNFGIPADLIAIKNIDNNIDWTNSLPKHFSRYRYLEDVNVIGISENPNHKRKFKSIFIFNDSLNNKNEYIIEGNEQYYTIKKK